MNLWGVVGRETQVSECLRGHAQIHRVSFPVFGGLPCATLTGQGQPEGDRRRHSLRWKLSMCVMGGPTCGTAYGGNTVAAAPKEDRRNNHVQSIYITLAVSVKADERRGRVLFLSGRSRGYSSRSVVDGSMRTARRDGDKIASRATRAKAARPAATPAPSNMPYCWSGSQLRTSREAITAIKTPAIAPNAVGLIFCRRSTSSI